jgi:hypothetical protein
LHSFGEGSAEFAARFVPSLASREIAGDRILPGPGIDIAARAEKLEQLAEAERLVSACAQAPVVTRQFDNSPNVFVELRSRRQE